jgi:thiaminase/transcriptional activator TenA
MWPALADAGTGRRAARGRARERSLGVAVLGVLVLSLAPALDGPAAATPRPQAGPTPPASFSDEVWHANASVYEAILAHPFLRGLHDGSLDRQRFVFYLVQDAHYLHDFADVLRVAADKAPRPAWAELLRRHARDSVAEEQRLQRSLLEQHGLGPGGRAAIERTPEAFAYANFLIATAHRGSFAETVAALLPCYWIYAEVGKALAEPASPDPLYRQWIEAYAGADYAAVVSEFRAIVDAVAAQATPGERERMGALYGIGVRYEWMFWDAAYERRGWPPPR